MVILFQFYTWLSCVCSTCGGVEVVVMVVVADAIGSVMVIVVAKVV